MSLVFSDNQSCTPRCHTLQSWHVTSAVLWLQPSKCECISKHLSLQDWRRLEQFFFLHISAIVFRTKNDGLFRIWFTNISWNCSKAPKSNTPALHYQFRGSLRQNIQDENENVHRDLKKIWKIKCTKIERQIYFLFPLNFLRSYKSKWYQVIHIGRQLSDLQVPCAQRGPAIQHRPSRLPESCIDGWPAFKDQNGSNDWRESPILPSMGPIGLEVPRDHKM